MNMCPIDSERLLRLLSLHADGMLDDAQWEELLAMVSTSEEARRLYIEHMFLHAMMHRAAKLADPAPRLPQGLIPVVVPGDRRSGLGESAGAAMLDLLGGIFRAGAGFLSQSFVLTLLLAVGLPGILLLILVLDVMRQPAPERAVATVTRTHECVWTEESAALWAGTDLFAGNELRLAEGFAEVAFARGGKVLLEGPAVLKVTSADHAFLRQGSLVAQVGKGAEGFTIKTPSVTVVDLGTEFGVRVEDARGTAQVEVFRGDVELRASETQTPEKTFRHRLSVGQAVLIQVSDRRGGLPTIRPITPAASAFVRQMPTGTVQTVVADFSGGAGNTQPDQFPGTAGAGWATGWGVGQAKELKCTASVDEAEPLLGGGKYLRVLAEREPGGAGTVTGSAVDRRVALTDRVDLTKPYVVSFDLRIDDLSRFTDANDRLSICARNVPQSQFSFKSLASSGWHVAIVGKPGKGGKRAVSGNWTFFQRDAEGKAVGVDSGIAPQEGSVYSFRILVDPAAKHWTPSIAVDGGKWTTFPRMGMRSTGTAEKNQFWAFLHFYYQLEGGGVADDVERIGFSVDSVRVVPQESGQTL